MGRGCRDATFPVGSEHSGAKIAQRGVNDLGEAVWLSLIEGCAVFGEADFGYVEIECRSAS
jgi:hypothetical protein